MAIKRDKWDAVFSDYVRYRDNWTCQRCSKIYVPKSRGLHCSHFLGRRSYSTRLEPANAMALCMGCHKHVSSFPLDHVKLWEEKFSQEERERVKLLRNDSSIKKRDVLTEENYKRLKLMLLKYTGEL
jgi:5-methylcytosine-specific restriction endonuclease McrA